MRVNPPATTTDTATNALTVALVARSSNSSKQSSKRWGGGMGSHVPVPGSLENANGSPEAISRATIIADVLRDCGSTTRCTTQKAPAGTVVIDTSQKQLKVGTHHAKACPQPTPTPQLPAAKPSVVLNARQRGEVRWKPQGTGEIAGTVERPEHGGRMYSMSFVARSGLKGELGAVPTVLWKKIAPCFKGFWNRVAKKNSASVHMGGMCELVSGGLRKVCLRTLLRLSSTLTWAARLSAVRNSADRIRSSEYVRAGVCVGVCVCLFGCM